MTRALENKATALAIVLAFALLLCHGVFGAAHLPVDVSPGEGVATHANHDGHDNGGEGVLSAHHEAEVSYFAVVFWLSVALAVSLLRFGARRRPAPVEIHHAEPLRKTVVPHLPRGPTLLFLQVFKL
ncbi:MAG: hypothetical protein ACRDSJ_03650 [Rubrobacteraceae bacterium]